MGKNTGAAIDRARAALADTEAKITDITAKRAARLLAGDTAAAIGKLDGELVRSDTLPLPSEIALRCLSKRWEAVKRLRADAGKLHRYSIKRRLQPNTSATAESRT